MRIVQVRESGAARRSCELRIGDDGMVRVHAIYRTAGAETTFGGSVYPLPPLSRDHRLEIASGAYYVNIKRASISL